MSRRLSHEDFPRSVNLNPEKRVRTSPPCALEKGVNKWPAGGSCPEAGGQIEYGIAHITRA
jgi:hypothetical protein